MKNLTILICILSLSFSFNNQVFASTEGSTIEAFVSGSNCCNNEIISIHFKDHDATQAFLNSLQFKTTIGTLQQQRITDAHDPDKITTTYEGLTKCITVSGKQAAEHVIATEKNIQNKELTDHIIAGAGTIASVAVLTGCVIQ